MLFHENTKLEQVFAILRFDADMAAEFGMKTDYISLKKVVRSEEQAIGEVERLNQLNGDKGAIYFWRSARLNREITTEADPAAFRAESVHQSSSTSHEA